MKFIKDYQKFKQFRIDEALESGQSLVYHRTRLKEESYTVDQWDKDVNLYDKFAKRNIPSQLKEESEEYNKIYNSSIELLKAMNPNIQLDDRGFPIVEVGDEIVTSDPRIMSQGFRPGSGDWYGVGLYTCYDFDDQIRDFDNDGVVDMSMYGPNIVEFKIENSGKFLVLDMNPDNNQAKKVWGQSHSLISQLKKIMGGKFLNFYNKNKELIDSFNEILVKTKVTTASGREEELKKDVQGRFLTAPIGLKLAEMPGFISLVDGMSFTGGNDGRVLVIYNANLAKPTRYTPDDGKTWIPMEKLEYQYDKVKVGNKDILQCKIIDTDKELNQISLDRPNSSKWIVSLDIPDILKDSEKSIKMFSEITLNKKQFKDNLDNLVDSLVKLSPQVIDNIIKRACQLPTDYSKLSSLDKKLGNYYSSLLYFITELGSKSKYTGNDINLKSDEILQSCGKAVDKLKFPLDLMFNLAEIVPSIDRYKNLFTSIINNSDTLYAGELTDRDEYDKMLNTILSVKDSDKYPDWFKSAISGKIDQGVEKSFEMINMENPSVSLGNLNIAGRFNHLVSKQILKSNTSNVDKFCQVLKADMISDDFMKIYKNKISMFYDNNKEASLLNTNYYSYPSSYGGADNWLIPKIIKLSSQLEEKEINILADFSLLYLSIAKLERYGKDSSGQHYLAPVLQGTPVYDRMIEKISKLKKEGVFTLFGVEDPEMKDYYNEFYRDITRWFKLGDDTLPDLNYKSIADSIFKAMYGPGTKKDVLFSEFKRIRNKKDLDKVIAEFGERKGMIGGSHDLNWWIKDELKDKDIEVINTDFKEKGIDYKF
jgi:hypothetical protein